MRLPQSSNCIRNGGCGNGNLEYAVCVCDNALPQQNGWTYRLKRFARDLFAMPPREIFMGNSRAAFDHHVVLCAFGGLVVGSLAALLVRDAVALPASRVVVGWSVLGLVHGPLLWPLLSRRPWWTTQWVVYAAVIGVAAVSTGRGGAWLMLGVPLAAMWVAALACWWFIPMAALPGCCRRCDYDLRGLPVPRCPECGTPFVPVAGVRMGAGVQADARPA